jgi:hypothetical protein
MHQILAVREVISHIVSYVESQDTLAVLARTSSVFSVCALDRLWHAIDRLVPLARCMPPGLWEEVERPCDDEPEFEAFGDCSSVSRGLQYLIQLVSDASYARCDIAPNRH